MWDSIYSAVCPDICFHQHILQHLQTQLFTTNHKSNKYSLKPKGRNTDYESCMSEHQITWSVDPYPKSNPCLLCANNRDVRSGDLVSRPICLVLVSVSRLALVSSWPRPSTRPDHMQRPRTFVWTASVELTSTSGQDVLHLVFKLIIPMLWIYTDQHLRSVQSHNYTCSTGAELGGTHKTRESRGLSIASLCLSITFSAPSAAPLSFTVQMKKALRGDANTACWL